MTVGAVGKGRCSDVPPVAGEPPDVACPDWGCAGGVAGDAPPAGAP